MVETTKKPEQYETQQGQSTFVENKEKLNNEEKSLVLAGIGIQNEGDVSLSNVIDFVKQGAHGSKRAVIAEVREEYSSLRMAYEHIKKKVDAKIKDHLKEMDVAVDNTQKLYLPEGSLKYVGKPFYIKEVHGDSRVPIAPSMDKSLGYEFFMFRLITGGKEYPKVSPYKLKDTHVVTFKKTGTTEYTKNDVLRLFKYYNEEPIDSHIGDVPNRDAFNIFKRDKQEVVEVLKEILGEHKMQCNEIKAIEPIYKDQITHSICATMYEPQDQDYYIQYSTCRELFTIASLDDFCKEQEEVTPSYFDEI